MTDSSIVPTRLEMELNVCLALYFTETSEFSTLYWPRSLRLFLSEILSSAFLNFNGFDPHLAVPDYCGYVRSEIPSISRRLPISSEIKDSAGRPISSGYY